MNSEIAPWTLCQTSGDAKRGKEAIAQGRVAAVVLAAGQGSRFDPAKLKGEVPVTASGKSLFCLMAERIAAASKLYKRPLKVAFMTSPQNDAQVRNYFAQNGNFGLQQEQLDFFQQSEQQLLDEKMEPFHSGPNQWAKGPDGNGALFASMKSLYKKWSEVELVQILPVDNALGWPFEPSWVGASLGSDATVLVARRRSAEEKLGTLVEMDGHLRVVEYSELPAELASKKEGGEYLFGYLNLGLLFFAKSFMEKVAEIELPYHVAKKRSRRLVDGEVVYPKEPFATKYEKFIFDVFDYSKNVGALLVERGSAFAPLKNLTGESSIDGIKSALLAYDRALFERVSGKRVEEGRQFELSAEFSYAGEEFLKSWRQKDLPHEGLIG